MVQLSFINQTLTHESQQNKKELLEKLLKLRKLYEAGQLGGTTHEVYPELDRGSKDNYLYFTLAPSINFQRKSETLWQSALKTYNDPGTRFVFDPSTVLLGEDKFREALTKYGLAILTNKHTTIWFTLSKTFHEYYQDNPKNLLEECNFDVTRILNFLVGNKKKFPYLSGPKMSNYWLFILSNFTDVKFVNRHEISIIPDIHITRATKHLGLIPSDEQTNPNKVAKIWRDLLAGTEIAPSDLHAPLWRWSRRGFTPHL